MSTLCGGTHEVQDATPEVQDICDQVKPKVEEKLGKKFAVFIAKKFTSQVVAGRNYFIKVDVGGDACLHIRAFQPLPHQGNKPELHGVQEGKALHDPIGFF